MPAADEGGADAAATIVGRLDNARMLQEALQCIYSATEKTQDVEVSGSPRGMRFSVCTPGSLLASVVIPARAFTQFESDGSRVRVNLSLFADCLTMPAGDRPAAARLSIARDVLRLTLMEEDCRSESALRTAEGEAAPLDALRSEAARRGIMASAIVSSEALRDAVGELDYGGAETAWLRISPDPPRFLLAAPPGRRPAVEVEFADPLDPAQDTFDEFKCEKTVGATYRLALLQRAAKALAASDVSKITVNEHGSLAIVCKMRSSVGVTVDRCFVEFLILAQELEDNDEDEVDADEDEDEQRNDAGVHDGDYEGEGEEDGGGFW